MSNINKKLFKRLHLNHAYGQLIALIFVPITILACVGAALVLTETSNAACAQQKQMAIAILTRFQATSESALDIVNYSPGSMSRHAMPCKICSMKSICYVLQLWIFKAETAWVLAIRTRHLGQSSSRKRLYWPDCKSE